MAVCDHGAGVPEVERERVFDPFYRRTGTKEITGAGLGLALVRQIARQHGGDARYAPQGTKGSCFSVSLSARP
jgi:signal transduction histidine kinase